MKKLIIKTLKVVAINLILFELLAFIIIRFFHIGIPPLAYKQRFLPYFIDTNLPFTTWHYNNTITRHIGPSWNVEYAFNSYGARDIERDIKSNKKRFMFLGDSFLEGYGLPKKDRISDLFETQTGIEGLNFAASGLSQTQMRILYDSLASKFDHDAVIVTFYPHNDFKELDYTHATTFFANRHRPYSVKNVNGSFETKYYLATAEESAYHPSKYGIGSVRGLVSQIIRSKKSFLAKTYALFRDLCFSGALVDNVVQSLIVKVAAQNDFIQEIHILENLDGLLWELLNYELSSLKKSVDDKPLILLFIPNPYDFLYRKSLKKPTLVQQKMASTCDSLGIHYIDLLEGMPKEKGKKFYFRNDDHFNKLGSQVATEILIKNLKEKGLI